MEDINKTAVEIKEERYRNFKSGINDLWVYLWSKSLVILIVGLLGGAIGLSLSFIIKPSYQARIGFVLIDKSSGAGGLASLASSLGLGSILGSGSDNAFSGDNLLEIIQSRYAVEKALLTSMEYENQTLSTMDVYIQINDLHKKWKHAKNVELRTLSYPLDQDRETFTRTQDSIMSAVYRHFIKKEKLTVFKKDKNKGLVFVNFTSNDEVFSKVFVENLIEQTIQFYIDARTHNSRKNIDMMQHTADSIKALYDAALYGGAAISQVNVNRANQLAAVPRLQEESKAQLYGAVYAEVLKNLETLKLDLSRETPIIQVVETPRYPLKKNKFGKLKGIAWGGFVSGVLIVFVLLSRKSKLTAKFIKLFL
jgi:hypothetical protein